MTDLEISKALALAIGWKESQLKVTDAVFAWRGYWRVFDYRDWTVAGPIAERYGAFPIKNSDGLWVVDIWNDVPELSPQKAIALAVIEGVKV